MTIRPGFWLSAVCLGLAGCTANTAGPPPAPPTPVSVSVPIQQDVTDYAYFTGRVTAVDSVEVRSHVWGYLDKVNFTEGAIVKKGEVLFELDPRPYQALVDQAKAKITQDEAQLTYDEAEYERNSRLVSSGAVTKSDLDKTAAARAVDKANIAADKAALSARELDLSYTKVVAPVAGRVSRFVVTTGNLIQSGDQGGGTLLTTIVSVDPMYAYFDVDEHTALYVRQLVREGKSDPVREGKFPVALGLSDEDGYPHSGTINFVENQVNPKTGTVRLRGVFSNKDNVLLPGFFARIRTPVGRPHKGLLVNERSIDTDQGQKIVYVAGEDKKVAARPIQLGGLHAGLREITSGLTAKDRVIVVGLQQVRPGITVEPKLIDMPTGSAAATNQP
jgi:RND family efflux transporter MFP subunit